jgi:o-succinylbenzoate synthase
MKLRGSLYRYRLPLRYPLPLVNRSVEWREGTIVRLQDDRRHEGTGEISPLPGFSRETLDDTLSQSIQIIDEIGKVAWPDSMAEDIFSSELSRRIDALYYSVSFGLSSALLQLLARQKGTNLHRYVDPVAPDRVPVNALLRGSDEEILGRATTLNAEGYLAAKLKVGSRTVADDVAFVHRGRESLSSGVSLRLDANRRWNVDQASDFMKQTAGLDLEYIEEPINNLRLLPEFCAATNAVVALDESVAEYFATGMQKKFVPGAIVVKPTMIGSWGRCLKLRDWARENRVRITVSSSFESSLGLQSVAALAAVISGDTPSGLDTAGWFQQDLLTPGLVISKGHCELPKQPADWSMLNANLLTEVPRG